MRDEVETGKTEVWIELAQMDEPATTRGGLQLTSAASAKATARISDEMLTGVAETLRKVCQTVAGVFAAEPAPDEVVLKFGVKVGAKGGMSVLLLTEATGEATLAVEAKWSKPKAPTGP